MPAYNFMQMSLIEEHDTLLMEHNFNVTFLRNRSRLRILMLGHLGRCMGTVLPPSCTDVLQCASKGESVMLPTQRWPLLCFHNIIWTAIVRYAHPIVLFRIYVGEKWHPWSFFQIFEFLWEYVTPSKYVKVSFYRELCNLSFKILHSSKTHQFTKILNI